MSTTPATASFKDPTSVGLLLRGSSFLLFSDGLGKASRVNVVHSTPQKGSQVSYSVVPPPRPPFILD